MLTSAPVLQYFDGKKPILIQSDSSQFALGAALIQDGKILVYASRTLTPAELNYAQIEKELSGMLFAVGKWNYYIFGRRITCETDDRPLISILKNR